jgi:hypothetical protein
MNHPVGEVGLVPASILHIEGDPTSWGLRTVPPQDPGWDDHPVAIEIGAPVAGTLILSPARVGHFVLTPTVADDGWMPGITLAAGTRYLYLPTGTALTAAPPGYLLAAHYDLTALRQSIMNAMSGAGSTLTVDIAVHGGGVVVLNGAHLRFAVLAEAASLPRPRGPRGR